VSYNNSTETEASKDRKGRTMVTGSGDSSESRAGTKW